MDPRIERYIERLRTFLAENLPVPDDGEGIEVYLSNLKQRLQADGLPDDTAIPSFTGMRRHDGERWHMEPEEVHLPAPGDETKSDVAESEPVPYVPDGNGREQHPGDEQDLQQYCRTS